MINSKTQKTIARLEEMVENPLKLTDLVNQKVKIYQAELRQRKYGLQVPVAKKPALLTTLNQKYELGPKKRTTLSQLTDKRTSSKDSISTEQENSILDIPIDFEIPSSERKIQYLRFSSGKSCRREIPLKGVYTQKELKATNSNLDLTDSFLFSYYSEIGYKEKGSPKKEDYCISPSTKDSLGSPSKFPINDLQKRKSLLIHH